MKRLKYQRDAFKGIAVIVYMQIGEIRINMAGCIAVADMAGITTHQTEMGVFIIEANVRNGYRLTSTPL